MGENGPTESGENQDVDAAIESIREILRARRERKAADVVAADSVPAALVADSADATSQGPGETAQSQPPAPTDTDEAEATGNAPARSPAVADPTAPAAPPPPPDPTPEDKAKQELKAKIFRQIEDDEQQVSALVDKYNKYELPETAELIRANFDEIYSRNIFYLEEEELSNLNPKDEAEAYARVYACFEKRQQCARRVFEAIDQRKSERNEHFVFSSTVAPLEEEYLGYDQVSPILMDIGTFDSHPTSRVSFEPGRSELFIITANDFPAFAGNKIKQTARDKFAGMRVRETGEEATAEQKIEYLIGVVKAINARECNLVLGKNQHTGEITLIANDNGLLAKYEDDNVRVDSQEDLSLVMDDRDWRVDRIGLEGGGKEKNSNMIEWQEIADPSNRSQVEITLGRLKKGIDVLNEDWLVVPRTDGEGRPLPLFEHQEDPSTQFVVDNIYGERNNISLRNKAGVRGGSIWAEYLNNIDYFEKLS